MTKRRSDPRGQEEESPAVAARTEPTDTCIRPLNHVNLTTLNLNPTDYYKVRTNKNEKHLVSLHSSPGGPELRYPSRPRNFTYNPVGFFSLHLLKFSLDSSISQSSEPKPGPDVVAASGPAEPTSGPG